MLVEERKRFLARRPKDKPVKGINKPTRKVADRIILVGDPESESVGCRTKRAWPSTILTHSRELTLERKMKISYIRAVTMRTSCVHHPLKRLLS
jgi:hypothetical protein